MSIEVQSLSFSYNERPILRDVSFCVRPGEFLSVLGPNGIGKSTLFRCLLGLLNGYSGSVLIDGRDARTLSPREMARKIAYIPQSAAPAFHYSVYDIVLMGTTGSFSAFSTPGKRERLRAEEALEKMGISHLAGRCFHKISGGERQLALIARALAQSAPILMLDEPTASLDFGNRSRVLSQVKQLSQEGYTVIQTTHDPEQAYLYSDRILALRDGQVLKLGSPQEVLTADVIRALYGVEVNVLSLYEDRLRVCTPAQLTKGGIQ